MCILLDENLPRKLKHAFAEHAVSTVAEMGWAGLQNGELLSRAEAIFDVLVTADKNIPAQNHVIDRNICFADSACPAQ
ncbi:MAG: hypothetical protein GY862_12630 [Gammaproteobacteria bacterium]|nr:hypothetical protein [Gammaproteobacteria bacterium]